MATIAPVITKLAHGIIKVTWDFAGSDTCLPAKLGAYPDKTMEFFISGAIGTSSISLEGTSDEDAAGNPQNFKILHKPGGTALTYTAAGIDAVVEDPHYFKPVDTVPGNGSGLRATLTCRRNITKT